MVLPNSKEDTTMNHQLRIGQTVRTFGILAKVDAFHEITGDPILRFFWNNGTRWLSKAELCEPVEYTSETICHKDGLVSFDAGEGFRHA
jgi:hypothetical protein